MAPNGSFEHGDKIVNGFVSAGDPYYYQEPDGRLNLRVDKLVNPRDPAHKSFPTYVNSAPLGAEPVWKKKAIYEKHATTKWKPVPYNLLQLIKADAEEPIFICEGEKDCDALDELGLIATTNPGGALKWRVFEKHLNPHLKDRKLVYILQDNDDYGRQHAEQVHDSLEKLVGKVNIIELPGVNDVSDWIAAGGTKKALLELCKAQAEALARIEDSKVKIVYKDGHGPALLKQIENAMIERNCKVFIRGEQLVEPIWYEYRSANSTTRITVLRVLGIPNLSHIMEKEAVWFYKKDGRSGNLVNINAPEFLLDRLLAKGHWAFKQISGTINAPTMRPDGSIFDGSGLDPATRLWRWDDDSIKMPKILTSRKAAQDAYRLLTELFAEVPFVNEFDRSVAIAALITTIVRGAFDMAPMFLFQAHAARTGKSYLVDIISHIATGRWCPVLGMGKSEEAEKRIAALLIGAPPMISFDNLEGNISGQAYCHLTERPLVTIRILGSTKLVDCEWRGTLFATGNNVQFAGDMVDRGLTCNLDAVVEHPGSREFKASPIEMVKKDRGKYIAAVLTIVKAYLASGEKVKLETFGSFNEWSRFVRGPIVWLGHADPLLTVKEARREDPDRHLARQLFEQWVKHMKPPKGVSAEDHQGFRVQEIVERASATRDETDDEMNRRSVKIRPEFFEVLYEKAASQRPGLIDTHRLGFWLRSIKGQVHADWRLIIGKSDNSGGHRWKLERVERLTAGK